MKRTCLILTDTGCAVKHITRRKKTYELIGYPKKNMLHLPMVSQYATAMNKARRERDSDSAMSETAQKAYLPIVLSFKIAKTKLFQNKREYMLMFCIRI